MLSVQDQCSSLMVPSETRPASSLLLFQGHPHACKVAAGAPAVAYMFQAYWKRKVKGKRLEQDKCFFFKTTFLEAPPSSFPLWARTVRVCVTSG